MRAWLHDLIVMNHWWKAYLALVFAASVTIIAIVMLRHGWPDWWNLPLLLIGIPVGFYFFGIYLLFALFMVGRILWNGVKATFGSERNEAPAQYVLLQPGTDKYMGMAPIALGSHWRVGDTILLPSGDEEWAEGGHEIVDIRKSGKSITRVWIRPIE